MSQQPDETPPKLEVLEDDQSVPPRPEEEVADASESSDQSPAASD